MDEITVSSRARGWFFGNGSLNGNRKNAHRGTWQNPD
jgi:hypothetical protein